MNDALLFCLNLLLTFIEAVALYLLGSCFFESKYQGKQSVISVGILTLLLAGSLLLAQGIFIIKIPLLIVIDILWLNKTYKGNSIKALVLSVLYLSYMTIMDNLFIMTFATIMGGNMQALLANPQSYYLFCYAAKCVELLGIVVMRLIVRHRFRAQAATWQDWIRTIMFPTASLLIVILLLHVYAIEPSSAEEILICSIILMLTDVLAIILLNHIEQQQKAFQDNVILRHSIKLEQDNISAWVHAYAGQRKQTHDFQNQLAVIRGLAENETSNDELVKYVDSLLVKDFSSSLFVKTGRSVVDVILNQKYAIAQNKEIDFQVRLDNLKSFVLPDDELVIVLSNLIDNAIEACEKIELPEGRRILLKMQVTPDSSILYIENTTKEPVQISGNHVISARDRYDHGYGLKNISTIMESYDALYALHYDSTENKFCFSAQISPI